MRQFGKRFAYKVDEGKNAVSSMAGYRPYKLPRTPSNHEWLVGQRAVYVQPTAAGWMPTSIVGTIIGFVKDGRQCKAQMLWPDNICLASTISLQRLRPFFLIHGHSSSN